MLKPNFIVLTLLFLIATGAEAKPSKTLSLLKLPEEKAIHQPTCTERMKAAASFLKAYSVREKKKQADPEILSNYISAQYNQDQSCFEKLASRYPTYFKRKL